MNESMHFLDEIQNAYRNGDTPKALSDFFNKVQGYNDNKQFLSFMKECSSRRNIMERLSVIQELLEDNLDADSVEINDRNSVFIQLLCGILDDMNYSEENDGFGIQIFCNNSLEDQFHLTKTDRYHQFKNIRPGSYVIKLSTAMVIWQKQLQDEDVIFNKGKHQKELKLAARTEPGNIEPELEEIVMGKIKISVFAGIEAGIMEIRWL